MKPIEVKVCEFCKNTGVHYAPDVVEPVLIKCSNKNCETVALIEKVQELEEKYRQLRTEAMELRNALEFYNDEFETDRVNAFWKCAAKRCERFDKWFNLNGKME